MLWEIMINAEHLDPHVRPAACFRVGIVQHAEDTAQRPSPLLRVLRPDDTDDLSPEPAIHPIGQSRPVGPRFAVRPECVIAIIQRIHDRNDLVVERRGKLSDLFGEIEPLRRLCHEAILLSGGIPVPCQCRLCR